MVLGKPKGEGSEMLWLVMRKWKKGDWHGARRVLATFVATSVCVDYNGCDASRINTWFSDAKREPLTFFDLGRGVCFSSRGESIFGPDKTICRSVFAKLQTITDDLFVLNGRSCSQPVATSGPVSASSLSSSSSRASSGLTRISRTAMRCLTVSTSAVYK